MVDDINEEYPAEEAPKEEAKEEPQSEAPQEIPQEQPQPKKKSGLPKAIMTVAILVAGMYAIMFILEQQMQNFSETLNIDTAMITSLVDLGYSFIYVIAGILAILIVIYIITKLRKPAKSL